MQVAYPTPAHGPVRRYGFLLFLTPPLIPALCFALAHGFGAANVFAAGPLAYFFVLIPLADWLLGQDPANPADSEVASLQEDRFYRYLNFACVPLMAASLCAGAWTFVHWSELNLAGQALWILSYGLIGSVLAINGAHELIHKPGRFEQRLGGILLCLVCYPGFKIEHVRGHHVNVATPQDKSTARLNQSLYQFLPVTIANNVCSAWRLEAARLRRRNLAVIGWHNELLRWYALTLLFAAAMTAWLGWAGLVFFVGQSFFAVVLLEIVNYLEHYGLRRRRQPNGRYERTTREHSWNSNYLLTNMVLFHLQRHSDHHANPRRRYQVLRHFDDSPQLPAGYATMILLALVPPLWRRVMNPRVRAYYRQQPAQAAAAA